MYYTDMYIWYIVLPEDLEALMMDQGPDAIDKTKTVPLANGCRRKFILRS